jgi:hypothetical protein
MAFEIDLLELKRVVDRLLDHAVRDLHIARVEIKEDHYWHVDGDALYDMTKTPAEENDGLDIGSLSEDWEFASALLRDENEPIAPLLAKVVPLLRYIGERVREWS